MCTKMKLKRELYKEKNLVFGLEPNQKSDKDVVHVPPSNLGIFLIVHFIFECVLCVVC